MKSVTHIPVLLALTLVFTSLMAAQEPQQQRDPLETTAPPAEGARGGNSGTAGARPTPPPPPPAVMPAPVTPIVSTTAPNPDLRIGLTAGRWDAGQAAWNMRMISTTPPSDASAGATHSDLAFMGKYVVQGNYNGFEIWDISNPEKPVLANAFMCPASQNDISVFRNLLFMSSEATNSRQDCQFGGVPERVSENRVRGIRIFDITDVKNPKLVTSVQTCRGSHTHTVVTQPGDRNNVYIYVSGTAGVRPGEELTGCKDGPRDDPNSSRFRLEVIKVPLAKPAAAETVSSPRIFNNLPVAPRNEERARQDAADRAAQAAAQAAQRGGAQGGQGGQGAQAGQAAQGGQGAQAGQAAQGGQGAQAGQAAQGGQGAQAGQAAQGGQGAQAGQAAQGGQRGQGGQGQGGQAAAGARGNAPATPATPTGPNQCHDISVYPEIGLAGGACAGLGLLLDIKDAANPYRIDMAGDTNMSFWHSATFNNDGTKVLFSDEWGGGSQPRCRSTDKPEWGADALFTIENKNLVFHGYYKLPAPQTAQENCVAHNGSLIPIPGRDVMVQAFYQGGITVFDWTDIKKPREIAYFDRGPVDANRMVLAGSWSAYWYNGLIVSSEIARGLDIYELVPSGLITKNELDAARTVRFDSYNTQMQQKFVWPPSFPLANAYLDQLERSAGLSAEKIQATRDALAAAEKENGGRRRTALTRLATQLNRDLPESSDQAKMKLLTSAVNDLSRVR